MEQSQKNIMHLCHRKPTFYFHIFDFLFFDFFVFVISFQTIFAAGWFVLHLLLFCAF